jgi:hypothetical protein
MPLMALLRERIAAGPAVRHEVGDRETGRHYTDEHQQLENREQRDEPAQRVAAIDTPMS